ncbi:MAG: amidohydrolase family protein [Gemmatimonadota bacterium]|nr:amidohydrolase family protein [Gemmatimonadota bacterium]
MPTIAVLHSIAFLDDSTLARDPRLRYIPPLMTSGWTPKADFRFRSLTPQDWLNRKAAYAKQLQLVTLLHREGVRFLAGTDLSNPYIFPGFSLHDELASLVAAGFTPLEAIRSATIEAARFLGAADSLGSVATGKRADLLLLDADPLTDIRNTTRIAVVVAAGRVVDRAARERLLAEEEKTARIPPAPPR